MAGGGIDSNQERNELNVTPPLYRCIHTYSFYSLGVYFPCLSLIPSVSCPFPLRLCSALRYPFVELRQTGERFNRVGTEQKSLVDLCVIRLGRFAIRLSLV